MSYNDNQDISVKYQDHHQAVVGNLTPPQSSALQQVFPTSYILVYDDYATGSFSAGNYTYVQPHAPRTLVVKPTVPTASNDPRISHKKLQYDANGNLTSVSQNITTPGAPLADTQLLLRQYRWDEENRLRAVDLQPENPTNQPKIAAYTYDASGQRVVRYVSEQLKAYFSGHPSGRAHQLEIAVYPSGFISAKALTERGIHKEFMTYTKHFYIGSQRVASVKGGSNGVGRYLSNSSLETASSYFGILQEKRQTATQALAADYAAFNKTLTLPQPFALSPITSSSYRQQRHTYWFHPDHLGSSSYISNINGRISQHIEYFPFGETLVEEHKNSNNSPYKFNGKMLDAETGNYYYGARYYNPKWSLWLSVDPLAENYPGWSPYNYTLYNPVRFVDPDGRSVAMPDNWYKNKETGEVIWIDGDKDYYGYENLGFDHHEVFRKNPDDLWLTRVQYDGDTKTKSVNRQVVKHYESSTMRKGYNFVMDNFVGSTMAGVQELGWIVVGTGIAVKAQFKEVMNGGDGLGIHIDMAMPIYVIQNGKLMKMDLAEYSFGELVSNGFSGLTALAGGTSTVFKTGIKEWYGEAIDYLADKTLGYYIGEGLGKLKGK